MKVWAGACVALFITTFGQPAFAIQKCQDQNGKWHYGDFAVEECRRSKVTTLNERGVVKDEREAPKTQAEIQAEAEAQQAADEQAERERLEAEERDRILSIYETEADIERQRDNQLYSVRSNIEVHKAYLESLADREQRGETQLQTETRAFKQEELKASIEEAKTQQKVYRERLQQLEKQQEEIVERFDREIKLYRELTKTAD